MSDNLETYFAEIILPLGIGHTFTYRIPQNLLDEIIPGKRVLVPFGKTKVYAGILYSIHNKAPKEYEAKYIYSVFDSEPVLSSFSLTFWLWLSEYYLCTLGEVMKAALPSGLKLESESYLSLNPDTFSDFEINVGDTLSSNEWQIIDLLKSKPSIRLSDVTKLIPLKSALSTIKFLIKKNIVFVSEELKKGYIPKKKTYIQWSSTFEDPQIREKLFQDLEKKPNHLHLLLSFIHLRKKNSEDTVSKSQLLETAQLSESVLSTMVKNGVFEIVQKRISRLEPLDSLNATTLYSDEALNTKRKRILSESQAKAYKNIQESFLTKNVVLLHGVTSSGKTQIYFHLIQEFLEKQQQVLFLLPEIALTAQLVNRVRERFGDKVGLYHSNFNENERVETWEKVLYGTYSIIIGARSAIFLPFNQLGFIIIDEEHESSFKQYDPAPRYQARDAAIYLAYLQNAKVLLGTATPSIESYYHAQQGKYGLVELNDRFGGVQPPEVELIDLRKVFDGAKNFHFSAALILAIKKILEAKEQAILFQNRRGYSTLLVCTACGFVPKCIRCDVSLTLHKFTEKLHCHYCGYRAERPVLCPVCKSPKIEEQGLGTEKIEEELKILIPEARVGRMDLDTTRGKNGHWKILSELEENKIDILVGTQMVSKGLDFGKVQLIGVMNADQILNFPDFRAFEKAYQILTQVSGRAGRRTKRGKVIIQTYSPKHPILDFIVKGDYYTLYHTEIYEREKFKYPPFTRLIKISCKNSQIDVAKYAAQALASQLKVLLGEMVLGPEEALIPRLRNYFIQEILLKIPYQKVSLSKVKVMLKDCMIRMQSDKKFKSTLYQIDVDPA